MALKGTIKDFALPDIFQLIGIQKKTGVLTLADGEESVTLKFFEGEVVGADTESMSLEDRLGQVLVRTERITQAQLDEALREQKNTLQRLGYLLVNSGHLSEADLVEALRVQSSQIIYRLFRWHVGDYHFEPLADLEYDQRHFTPISAETILMEGARMIDEWPIIERRIKNDRMVFRKSAAAETLDLTAREPEPAEDIEFDFGFDLDAQGEAERRPREAERPEKDSTEITLTPEERALLNKLDGRRTVAEVCDVMSIGDFDTYRTLADLLTRNLIEEVPQTRPRDEAAAKRRGLERLWIALGCLGVALASFASVMTLPHNPLTPWAALAAAPASSELRRNVSLSRLEKIERALEVFYLDSGALPEQLDVLARNGYLAPSDLTDSWGRQYAFRLSPGGWQLSVIGPDGQAGDLTVTRTFDGARQLMLANEEDPPVAND